MGKKLHAFWFLAALLAPVVLAATGGVPQQPPPQRPPEQGQQTPPQKPPQQGQQPPAGQQPPPTFRFGVSFVRVDVIVSDRKGEPVGDLKVEDFSVAEDGKPQKIETFKLVQIKQAEPGGEVPRVIRTQFDEEAEAARDDVRLFTIFLDDYHVRRGTAMSAREQIKRFVLNRLDPSDMVALMYPLTPVADVTFTRDHRAVAEAIEKFEGRKYNYQPRNRAEEQYALYPASVVERIRNDVALSAIKALVTHLGGLREGRKSVILVSEGYTNILPPQLRDPIAAYPGLGNPARRSPTVGADDPNEERAAFLATGELQRDLREVYDAANKNNTAIYAVDPRGLAAAEFDIDEAVSLTTDRQMLQATLDTLRVLAGETDGRAIVNRNDLEAGMKQILRDSSAYYLIGYNSSQAPSDGKFHEIKVRVARPGVQVRARKGYWALTAEETTRALAPPKPAVSAPVMEALASIAEPPRGRIIRSWVGASRGEDGKTRLTFVWEPMPRVPGTNRAEPLRVQVVASGANGTRYFRGSVPDAAAAALAPGGDAAGNAPGRTAPAGGRVSFDVEPGRVELRLSVEGRGSDVIDSEIKGLLVPDLTAPQVMLATPQVLRARSALEFRTISSDPNAIPTPTREFRRTDRLLIRFDAYAPGTSQATVTARLLNRAGERMSDLPVKPGAAPGGHVLDLPLAGLAAGEYLIELKATGEGGEARQLVAIRVTA
jgi:VWFA-related protein